MIWGCCGADPADPGCRFGDPLGPDDELIPGTMRGPSWGVDSRVDLPPMWASFEADLCSARSGVRPGSICGRASVPIPARPSPSDAAPTEVNAETALSAASAGSDASASGAKWQPDTFAETLLLAYLLHHVVAGGCFACVLAFRACTGCSASAYPSRIRSPGGGGGDWR